MEKRLEEAMRAFVKISKELNITFEQAERLWFTINYVRDDDLLEVKKVRSLSPWELAQSGYIDVLQEALKKLDAEEIIKYIENGHGYSQNILLHEMKEDGIISQDFAKILR